MQVMSREEIREFDRHLIEDLKIPGVLLMENAGRGCTDEILKVAGSRKFRKVLIVIGPGNNGGDGLVIARRLTMMGVKVEVIAVVERKIIEKSPDAFFNLETYEALGGHVKEMLEPWKLSSLSKSIAKSDAVIDCLFGTGLARPIEGFLAGVVKHVNLAKYVISVDIPSGLDANTGDVLGSAVKANLTLSLVCHKKGFDSKNGRKLCGKIKVLDIGFTEFKNVK